MLGSSKIRTIRIEFCYGILLNSIDMYQSLVTREKTSRSDIAMPLAPTTYQVFHTNCKDALKTFLEANWTTLRLVFDIEMAAGMKKEVDSGSHNYDDKLPALCKLFASSKLFKVMFQFAGKGAKAALLYKYHFNAILFYPLPANLLLLVASALCK